MTKENEMPDLKVMKDHDEVYLGYDDHGGILQWYFGSKEDDNCDRYALCPEGSFVVSRTQLEGMGKADFEGIPNHFANFYEGYKP